MKFVARSRVRLVVGLLAGVLFVSLGSIAFAQTPLQSEALQQFSAATILPQTPLPIVIARLIRTVIGVLGILLTILVLYAGWLYMTAGGDPKKTDTAKAILKNATIGLVITLSSFAITQFILGNLTAALGLGGISSATALQRYSEPLGGALDGRTIQDHYPSRDQLGVPRNTRIMVTFTEPVSPASIIEGWTAANPNATGLNITNVKIFETANTQTAALVSEKVVVGVSADHRSFVFDPVDLLGNGSKDTNYSVALKSGVLREGGKALFTGRNSNGYLWTFEVSTVVDLTPPKVVSIQPAPARLHDRNTTVEITFNEAMDPIAASGIYSATSKFAHISVSSQIESSPPSPLLPLNGTFEISNGYRTVGFTPDKPCAEDLCGNVIYCLPGQLNIHVRAQAATLKDKTPGASAEAEIRGGGVDGLTDTAGNSLDGGGANCVGDGIAQGNGTDDCAWNFTTNSNIDDRTPSIAKIVPGIHEPLVNVDAPVTINFDMPMKISTLVNTNIQLWPDPYYDFWFVTRSEGIEVNGQVDHTRVSLGHKSLWRKEDGGYNYYPLVTNDVRGNNQFCLFPAVGPSTGTEVTGTTPACTVTEARPYCCNGDSSSGPCQADESTKKLGKPVLLPLTPP